MKQCPKCSRVYADDALNFCLDDGEWLIDGAKSDEAMTEMLPSSGSLRRHDEKPTKVVSKDFGTSGNSRYWLIAAVLVIGIGGALLLFYRQGYFRKGTDAGDGTVSFETMKLSRLTTTGKAISAAISPDGKYVAYVNLDVQGGETNSGLASIWVKQVATGQNIKIVDSNENVRLGLTFSPDSNYLYYRFGSPFGPADLYRISVLGGDAQKVVEELFSSVSFSPDGKNIAFIRNHRPVMGKTNVIIANSDGSDERIVSTHENGELFASPGRPTTPAWSPDGKHLVAGLSRPNGSYSLIDIAIADGRESIFGPQSWSAIDSMAFAKDGSSLFVDARDQSSPQLQIWQLSYPSGDIRRVTNDLNAYQGLSLSQDGKSMAVTQTALESALWLVIDGKTNEAHAVTSGTNKSDGFWGISWTPDGKIVYVSNASGNLDIWILDPERGTQKQLTSNVRQNYYPCATSDGRYIVFLSDRGDGVGIWRINIDGTNARQLVSIKPLRIACSPDGQSIVYSAPGSKGVPALWKVGIDGGQPTLLNEDNWEEHPAFSPDGKQIAFQYFGNDTPVYLGLYSIESGAISKLAEPPHRLQPTLRWTPEGNGIAYIDFREGIGNIWELPVRGGAPKQLTDFKSDAIFWFDWSRDGRSLALARGTQISDVVLISNSK